jgi:4-hydroxy-L-threonine phosphate dehydrogenase PdxA
MTATATDTALPIVATMIGDPAGIGPEVSVKALATGLPQRDSRVLLIGSIDAVDKAIACSGVTLKTRRIESVAQARFEPDTIDVLDAGMLAPDEWRMGEPSAASGRAVWSWLETAATLAEEGHIQGWIMGPIDRKSLKMGVGLSDDVEVAPPDTYLLRMGDGLIVVPISEHLALREVPGTVTRARVGEALTLLHETLERWGLRSPRIAVAGLNPHARGTEELQAIGPAVQDAKARGIDVRGPVSPDSVFRQCIEKRHDAVLTMYHDQGQIALKTVSFEGACSVYMGLPYVHLTVPHGSAFDIAGKGVAQHRSMLRAMRTAAALCAGRYSMELNNDSI